MPTDSNFIAELLTQLQVDNPKKQLSILHQLATLEEPGLQPLMDFLLARRQQPAITYLDGTAYRLLWQSHAPQAKTFLQAHWPDGLVTPLSDKGLDYSELQQSLLRQDFEAADRLTLKKLCELAGSGAVQRGWLYFTEVENFPGQDLNTLDQLWQVYSEGRFGFSKQRQIWLSNNQNWEKLWEKIAWKKGNAWTRYPNEFIWDLSAPEGHLPLSNQLRGVRAMASLLTHPVWS
ncbi:GUN4 N-terminal ARM-like repeat domain-containing protein [Almyronema epifaneia]|uniref:GUN4 N-terminal ARM-like repeat domain-containing protein n=1 Tax=Almyronema epifaneia S1 TaxID=2991925 RepID=A0ABW6IJ30_9CYAN